MAKKPNWGILYQNFSFFGWAMESQGLSGSLGEKREERESCPVGGGVN